MATEIDAQFEEDVQLNDLDSPNFIYDPSTKTDLTARKAVESVAKGAIDGILSSNTARTMAKALVNHALPRGYVSVVNAVDDVLDSSRFLYNSALKRIKPAADSVKRLLSNNEETIDKALPAWAADKVKTYAKSPKYDDRPYVDPTESAIQAAMLNVFKRSAIMEERKIQFDIISKEGEEARSDVYHEQSLRMMDSVASGIGRLVGYQDTILEKYHAKDLELQMRQYFVLRDSLAVTKAYADSTQRQLEAVVKNTALPDFVKMKTSELIRQRTMGSITGAIHERMSGFTQKFRGRVNENIRNQINGGIGNVADGVGSVADMALNASGAISSGGPEALPALLEGVGDQLTNIFVKNASKYIARTIGATITNPELMNRAMDAAGSGATKIISKRNKQGTVAQTDARAQYIAKNVHKMANEFSQGRENGVSFDVGDGVVGRAVSGVSNVFLPESLLFKTTGKRILSAEQIASGKFISVKTTNPIRSKRDYTGGPIIGPNGESILSQEEYETGVEFKREASNSGTFANVLRTVVPKYNPEKRDVAQNIDAALKDSGINDVDLHTSVVDVIPGYLSKILKEVTTISSGSTTEALVYSNKSGKFLTESAFDKEMDSKIFDDARLDRRRVEASTLAGGLDVDSKLSEEARSALTDIIIKARDSEERWNPEYFTSEKSLGGLKEEIAAEIKEVLRSEIEDIDWVKMNAMSDRFDGLGNMNYRLTDTLHTVRSAKEREALERLNIFNDIDGKLIANNEAIDNRLMGRLPGNYTPGSGYTPPTPPTSPTNPAVSAIMSAMSNAASSAGSFASDAAGVMGKAVQALPIGPGGLIGVRPLAMGGILKSVKYLSEQFDSIKNNKESIGDTISETARDAKAKVETTIAESMENAKAAANNLSDSFADIKSKVSDTIGAITNTVSNKAASVGSTVGDVMASTKDKLVEAVDFKDFDYRAAWDSAMSGGGMSKSDRMREASDILKEYFTKLKTGGAARAAGVLDRMNNVDAGVREAVKSAIDKFKHTEPDIAVDVEPTPKFTEGTEVVDDEAINILEDALPSQEDDAATNITEEELDVADEKADVVEVVSNIDTPVLSVASPVVLQPETIAPSEPPKVITAKEKMLERRAEMKAKPSFGATVVTPTVDAVLPPIDNKEPEEKREEVKINEGVTEVVTEGIGGVLNAINENFKTAHVLLQTIADNTSGIGNQGEARSKKGFFRKLQSGSESLFSLTKAYYRGMGKVGGAALYGSGKLVGGALKGIGAAVGGGLAGVNKVVGAAGRGLNKEGRIVDIFLLGRDTDEPIMKAVDIKEGKFMDMKTQKVIRVISEITGEVRDIDGNIIVEEKDVDNLVIRDTKGSGSSLFGGAKNIISGIYRKEWNIIKAMASIPLKILKSLTKTKEKIRDVFVKGEKRPRLLATILQNGGYFSSLKKAPIKSVKDIDSDILDSSGRVVLSLEDMQKGLVDSWGMNIRINNKIGRMLGIAGAGLKMAGKGMWSYYKVLAKATVGTAKLGGRVLGGTARGIGRLGGLSGNVTSEGQGSIAGTQRVEEILLQQLGYQKGLHDRFVGKGDLGTVEPTPINSGPVSEAPIGKDTVTEEDTNLTADELASALGESGTADIADEAMTSRDYLALQLATLKDIADGPNRRRDDTDNDGYRDGSWQDRLLDGPKKEVKEDKPKEKEKEKEETKSDILGTIVGGIGGIMSAGLGKITDLIGMVVGAKAAGNMLSTGADIADMAGGAGKKGLLRRGASAVGRGLMTAGKYAVPAMASAGTAIGGAAASAAGAVGAALGTGALVGGAVILGGVALAAGAVYGGYKLYKHLSYGSAPEPLEGLRYLQYGINLEDEDFIYAVRKLEEEALDGISGTGRGAVLEEDPGYYYQEFAEDFQMSLESESDAAIWVQWFTKRFTPVLMTHRAVLMALDSGADLDDIDDDLDDDLKARFVRSVQFNEKDRAAGTNPYAVTQSPFKDHPLISDVSIIDAYVARLLATLDSGEDIDDFDVDSSLPAPTKEESDEAKAKGDSPGIDKTTSVEDQKSVGILGGLMNGLKTIAGFTPFGMATMGSESSGFKFISNTFKKLTFSKVEPLEGLRYLQYGASLNDIDFIEAIRALEDEVIDESSVTNGKFSIDEDVNYFYEEFHEVFGLSFSNKIHANEWSTWYNKRFLPIFIMHLAALEKVDRSSDLDDIDDDLSDVLKLQFILEVQITDKDRREKEFWPYGIEESPMLGRALITDAATIDLYIKKLIDMLKLNKNLDAFDSSFLPPAAQKAPNVNVEASIVAKTEEMTLKQEAAKKQEEDSDVISIRKDTDNSKVNAPPVEDDKVESVSTNAKLISPVRNGVVTSMFGKRIHPVTGKPGGHGGVDYGGKMGTPIYAASDGVIYRQYRSQSYGNVVYLRHPDNTSSRYAHLQKFGIGNQEGTELKQGDIVGYMGNTGVSTGPHLHFEYRKTDDQYADVLDPLKYFESKDVKKLKENTVAKNEVPNYIDGPIMPGVTTTESSVGNLSEPAIKPTINNESVKSEVVALNAPPKTKADESIPKVDSAGNAIDTEMIVDSQGKIADSAAQQRAAQIEAQKQMVAKMDTLINTMAANNTATTKPNTVAAANVTPPGRQRQPWPQTKTTTGVMDFGH